MSSAFTALLGNTLVVSVEGLKNSITDNYENAATVQVTITDSDGDEVVGETWPKTMPYVSGSDGNYRVTLASSLLTDLDNNYSAVITADDGGGSNAQWNIDINLNERKC